MNTTAILADEVGNQSDSLMPQSSVGAVTDIIASDVVKTAKVLRVNDEASLDRAFADLADKVKDIMDRLDNAVVTEQTEADVEVLVKSSASILRRADDLRKDINRPYQDEIDKINTATKKRLLDPLDKAVKAAKQKLLDFKNEKEKQRLKDLKRIKDEQAAKAAADKAEADRKATHRNSIDQTENAWRQRLALSIHDPSESSPDSVQRLIAEIEASKPEGLEEFADLYLERRNAVLLAARSHSGLLKSAYEQRMAAMKANTDLAERRRMAEEAQQKAEEQRAKLKAEQDAADALKTEQKKIDDERALREQEQRDADDAQRMQQLESEKTTGLRGNWTHEVTEFALVPREYLTLDEKAVKAAISVNKKALEKGGFTIPGIRIFKKSSLSGR